MTQQSHGQVWLVRVSRSRAPLSMRCGRYRQLCNSRPVAWRSRFAYLPLRTACSITPPVAAQRCGEHGGRTCQILHDSLPRYWGLLGGRYFCITEQDVPSWVQPNLSFATLPGLLLSVQSVFTPPEYPEYNFAICLSLRSISDHERFFNVGCCSLILAINLPAISLSDPSCVNSIGTIPLLVLSTTVSAFDGRIL